MTDQATDNREPSPPVGVSLIEGLGLAPEREAYARWLADTHAPALRKIDSDGAHAAGYAAGVYAERLRWIAACNTVSDGAERAHRPGVQTVAQVRKLAIDGPNVNSTADPAA